MHKRYSLHTLTREEKKISSPKPGWIHDLNPYTCITKCLLFSPQLGSQAQELFFIFSAEYISSSLKNMKAAIFGQDWFREFNLFPCCSALCLCSVNAKKHMAKQLILTSWSELQWPAFKVIFLIFEEYINPSFICSIIIDFPTETWATEQDWTFYIGSLKWISIHHK